MLMTKQRLQEYLWLKKNIIKLEEELAEIDTRLTKTTRPLSDMPKNKTPKDLTNELLARKIDLQNTINSKLVKCYVELETIEKAISSLPNREQCLFRLRYIQGATWEDICVELNYSLSQIHKLHGETLKNNGWV